MAKKTLASAKKSTEIEQYWREYSAALVRWKLAYEVWHKAGSEAIEKYNLAVQNTIGPENFSKTLAENWKKAWMETGLERIEKFGDEWQHMLKASGLESIHKYNEEWQKFWTKPGLDPSKNYFEAMKQFSKSWQDMWKK
jgi:hypothetical protein